MTSDQHRSPALDRTRRLRAKSAVFAALAAACVLGSGVGAPFPERKALAQDSEAGGSVATSNGVVVHGVDRGLLASRIREVDGKMAAGTHEDAARELADLASADLSALLEDGEGTYLCAEESVLQRVAGLNAAGLAAYRRLLDPRARVALDAATRTADLAPLAREATRLVHTSHGWKLLATLADLRMAQGDTDGAARALEDALRLRPTDDGASAGLPRTALVSRLAGILATSGDVEGVRALAAELSPEALALPSPLRGTRTGQHETARVETVRQELDLALHLASTRNALAAGPTGELTLSAEVQMLREGQSRLRSSLRQGGGFTERPLAVNTGGTPGLFARVPLKESIYVTALLVKEGQALRSAWTWPHTTSEAAAAATVIGGFAPARVDDDTVAFAWPVEMRPGEEEGRQELVLLSLSGGGRLVERRGTGEAARADGNVELEGLSFVGRPAVVGDAVYATLVAQPMGGGTTELSLARFDVRREGTEPRLRLRWLRHVLDGMPVAPALYLSGRDSFSAATAAPSHPLVVAGRVFVASNSGAVACLDTTTGRVEWLETYARFGPSGRNTVKEADPASWGDVPLHADGPYIYVAPRDSSSLIQFRRAPRNGRGTRMAEVALSTASGTAALPGRVLLDLIPDRVIDVRQGVAYLAGAVAYRPIGGLPSQGSPLAAISFSSGSALGAQIEEAYANGAPAATRDAIFFPTAKALYRVRLSDVEGTPQVVWKAPARPERGAPADRLGDLVADGSRVWSVTASRIVLFEPR